MRIVLPIAVLFAAATGVSAQERAQIAEPVAAITPKAQAATAPAHAVTAEKPVKSVVMKSRFEQVRSAPAETATATQTVPRGWWWTVGAIVLALVIVAVIL